MKKNRIIALLTVIVFGTCIVGCGTGNQEDELSNKVFTVKEISDNYKQYKNERITIKGRATSFSKSDEPEYGAYSLALEDIDASEVITCFFENDDLQALYTFEGTDYLEEKDARRLITISGQYSYRKMGSVVVDHLTECEVTAISSSLDDLLHQTDESSGTETSSITTKTDSAQDSESTETISKAQKTFTYSEFMSELEELLQTPEYNIYDEKYYSDPLDGFNLMPHNEQKNVSENGETIMQSIYFQSNRNPDVAIILGVKIENNKIMQIIVASAVNIKNSSVTNEAREQLMDFMMIPCGVLEQCENRNEIHELYEEIANSEKANSLNNSFTYELNKNTWSATMKADSVDGTWIFINPQPDKREKSEARKSESETSKTALETTKAIPVDTITSAYNNNEVSANNDYLNKSITIKGTVYKVEKVNNPSYASDLEPGEYHVYLMGSSPVDWVNCYFDSEVWISNLNRGDEIMISGTCIGIPSFALHPCMKGCSRSY